MTVTAVPNYERNEITLLLSGAPHVKNSGNSVIISADKLTVTISRGGWSAWRFGGAKVEGRRVGKNGTFGLQRGEVVGWNGLLRNNEWIQPIVQDLLDRFNASTSPLIPDLRDVTTEETQ